MGFGDERPASVALGRGEGLKRSLDGLRGLPLGVLVERLGGEALRFRDERRLAGLVKLEGEDADGGDVRAAATDARAMRLRLRARSRWRRSS